MPSRWSPCRNSGTIPSDPTGCSKSNGTVSALSLDFRGALPTFRASVDITKRYPELAISSEPWLLARLVDEKLLLLTLRASDFQLLQERMQCVLRATSCLAILRLLRFDLLFRWIDLASSLLERKLLHG